MPSAKARQQVGVPTSRDLPRFPHHKPTRKQFSGLLLLENTEDYKRSTLNNQTAHHQSHWITITTTNPTPNMFSETQGKSTFRRMSAEDDEMYQTPVTVSTFVDSSWSIRSHEMAVRSSLHVCFAMRLRFIQLSSIVFKMDCMVSISALTSTVFIHVWVWLIIVDNHDVESHDKICIPSIDLAIEDVDYIFIDSVDKRSHASTTTSLSLSLHSLVQLKMKMGSHQSPVLLTWLKKSWKPLECQDRLNFNSILETSMKSLFARTRLSHEVNSDWWYYHKKNEK